MKRLLSLLVLIKSDIILLRNCLFDSRVEWKIKGAIVGMVLYMIAPIDILSDTIPLLGQVDDIVVIITLTNWIKKTLPKKMSEERHGKVIEGK